MKFLRALFLTVTIGFATQLQGGENWPQFRGPNGDGLSAAKGLPLTWSETNNVKWKTAIHGRAWSSPVVWGKQVWLTTATEDGKQLSAICVDGETGKIIHDVKLFDVDAPQFAHKFNTYGSPTPVIEEGRVYVTFGSPGTACLDTETAKVIWERRDFECNHYRGAGSSPILYENLLLMHFDGSDKQYVVALDKSTGKTRWRRDRSIDYKDLLPDGKPEAEGDWRKAFATPHVAMIGGQPVMVSIGAKATYGYDPVPGLELWRVEDRASHSGSTRPVVVDDLIVYPTGFGRAQLLAIRNGARGEVIDVNKPEPADANKKLKLEWKATKGIPNKPSLQRVGDLLFTVNDGGVASCLELATGKEIWNERVGGNYSASPIAADGRIYFCNEEGKTVVVAAAREFKILAENKLDEGFMASPAVMGNTLILRTKTHLYSIAP